MIAWLDAQHHHLSVNTSADPDTVHTLDVLICKEKVHGAHIEGVTEWNIVGMDGMN